MQRLGAPCLRPPCCSRPWLLQGRQPHLPRRLPRLAAASSSSSSSSSRHGGSSAGAGAQPGAAAEPRAAHAAAAAAAAGALHTAWQSWLRGALRALAVVAAGAVALGLAAFPALARPPPPPAQPPLAAACVDAGHSTAVAAAAAAARRQQQQQQQQCTRRAPRPALATITVSSVSAVAAPTALQQQQAHEVFALKLALMVQRILAAHIAVKVRVTGAAAPLRRRCLAAAGPALAHSSLARASLRPGPAQNGLAKDQRCKWVSVCCPPEGCDAEQNQDQSAALLLCGVESCEPRGAADGTSSP